MAAAVAVAVGVCTTSASASASPSARPAVVAVLQAAPAQPFAVGSRQLALARGSDRPLPTTVWYPAIGTPVTGKATVGATPATGRFPIVLLSHGLTSLPSDLAAFGTRWAAAGFVVAAPAFPHTKRGSPIPVLFVHGDADATVSYRSGRAAYTALTWPKGFLTLTGGSHTGYLFAGGKGFGQVAATSTDFLRWTLYGDTAAQGRLAADATAPGTSTWESTF